MLSYFKRDLFLGIYTNIEIIYIRMQRNLSMMKHIHLPFPILPFESRRNQIVMILEMLVRKIIEKKEKRDL